jgi:dishevelled associated activator of morphogenesis
MCPLECLSLGRDDEPPEITYCVVDGAGTLNLQAVTPAIPMPEDEEELNMKFAELVVSK